MLIGFAGFAGVGKSTLTKHCIDKHGFVERSFAGPLKRIVQDLYGFSDQQMYGPSEFRNAPDKRYPRGDGTYLTPRLALERFGTEAGRYCYPNTWCEKAIALAKVSMATGSCGGVAFSDARFINEFEAIRANGGYIVRLERSNIACGTHESETEQATLADSYFDLVLCTDYSKVTVQAAFDDWYQHVLTKAA